MILHGLGSIPDAVYIWTPWQNIGGDGDSAYYVDGWTDIISGAFTQGAIQNPPGPVANYIGDIASTPYGVYGRVYSDAAGNFYGDRGDGTIIALVGTAPDGEPYNAQYINANIASTKGAYAQQKGPVADTLAIAVFGAIAVYFGAPYLKDAISGAFSSMGTQATGDALATELSSQGLVSDAAANAIATDVTAQMPAWQAAAEQAANAAADAAAQQVTESVTSGAFLDQTSALVDAAMNQVASEAAKSAIDTVTQADAPIDTTTAASETSAFAPDAGGPGPLPATAPPLPDFIAPPPIETLVPPIPPFTIAPSVSLIDALVKGAPGAALTATSTAAKTVATGAALIRALTGGTVAKPPTSYYNPAMPGVDTSGGNAQSLTQAAPALAIAALAFFMLKGK